MPNTPTDEDLRDMATMEAHGKPVVMLRPRAAAGVVPPCTGKIGGSPDLPPDYAWPACRQCNVPLRFVLQLFESDVPEFPFPAGRGQFVLFWCPRKGCQGSGAFVRTIQFDFFTPAGTRPRQQPRMPELAQAPIPESMLRWAEQQEHPQETLEIVKRNFSQYEKPIAECPFHPLRTIDHPTGYEDSAEWWGGTFLRFRKRYEEEDWDESTFGQFVMRVRARVGTKVGGFASWQQGADYPTCACGRRKAFVLQISSEDRDPDPPAGQPPGRRPWSDHGIMIGDLGNFYFFTCPACGPESFGGNWDCG